MKNILLKSPGGFLTPRTARWRMGQWSATDQDLDFFTDKFVVWTCPYKNIANLSIEERSFAFGTKHSIHIQYGEKQESVWLIVADNLDKWKNLLHDRATAQFISEEQLFKLAEKLDVVSEELLWYLWQHKYASLDELMAATKINEPALVLNCIKKTINSLSQELFGYPLCVFKEEYRISDHEIIKNKWWVV